MGHVVSKIVVDVMLKPEILDPQGQAVAGALPRVGYDRFTEVRQGKRLILTYQILTTRRLLKST